MSLDWTGLDWTGCDLSCWKEQEETTQLVRLLDISALTDELVPGIQTPR